jgi:hypothetical protein
MCDKELLVGYLYEELSAADRSTFEAHLFSCAECRDEVAGLRAARAHLESWAPPEPDLGFQIVRGAPPVVAERRFRFSPAWGLAAAAAFVLAVASAVANLEVTVGSQGLVVRTGWAGHAPAPQVTAATPPVAATPVAAVQEAAWRAELRRVDNRLRELEAAAAAREASPQVRAAASAGPRMSDAELIRQVRAIIADSESRQQRELALQMAQLIKDVDLQRRTDLARIQQGFGRLEAYTGAEVAQQREMLNRFVRVSQGR